MAYKLPSRLHFLAHHVQGQWVVACLDFNLGAQDDTFKSAHRRLQEQVKTYVETALTMDNGAHAEQLLKRRAPLRDWLLFHLGRLLQPLHAAEGNLRGYQRPSRFPQTQLA